MQHTQGSGGQEGAALQQQLTAKVTRHKLI